MKTPKVRSGRFRGSRAHGRVAFMLLSAILAVLTAYSESILPKAGSELSDTLLIEPGSPFVSSGPEGGPFEPSSIVYTLKNTGGAVLNWTAVRDAGLDWADLSAEAGALGIDESNTVTLTVNVFAL